MSDWISCLRHFIQSTLMKKLDMLYRAGQGDGNEACKGFDKSEFNPTFPV